jgi:hypothetical protein
MKSAGSVSGLLSGPYPNNRAFPLAVNGGFSRSSPRAPERSGRAEAIRHHLRDLLRAKGRQCVCQDRPAPGAFAKFGGFSLLSATMPECHRHVIVSVSAADSQFFSEHAPTSQDPFPACHTTVYRATWQQHRNGAIPASDTWASCHPRGRWRGNTSGAAAQLHHRSSGCPTSKSLRS